MRKLCSGDQDILRAFLEECPGYNAFMLGNLELEGWGSPDLEYWGIFTQGELAAVLMRCRNNWNAWWSVAPRETGLAFAEIIKGYPQSTGITGHPLVLEEIMQWGFSVKGTFEQRLALLKAAPIMPQETCSARWACQKDLDKLYYLYAGGEMGRSREQLLRYINRNSQALALDQGKAVSGVCVTARSSTIAMLGGVWTPPEHRGKGYASWCTAWVAGELHRMGISSSLFYHNPQAGSIYGRLGFVEQGPYKMIEFTT